MTEPNSSPPGEAAEPNGARSSAPSHVSENISFEDGIRRLGQIVEQLERGDLPLETSLRLFEEGIGLARISQNRLDRAERRIEELLGIDADGQVVTRPFEAKLDGG
ncbi:MAG TPA: exodeoxyribonuclease VII small subunit [Polyangiaceae bacterium]